MPFLRSSQYALTSSTVGFTNTRRVAREVSSLLSFLSLEEGGVGGEPFSSSFLSSFVVREIVSRLSRDSLPTSLADLDCSCLLRNDWLIAVAFEATISAIASSLWLSSCALSLLVAIRKARPTILALALWSSAFSSCMTSPLTTKPLAASLYADICFTPFIFCFQTCTCTSSQRYPKRTCTCSTSSQPS